MVPEQTKKTKVASWDKLCLRPEDHEKDKVFTPPCGLISCFHLWDLQHGGLALLALVIHVLFLSGINQVNEWFFFKSNQGSECRRTFWRIIFQIVCDHFLKRVKWLPCCLLSRRVVSSVVSTASTIPAIVKSTQIKNQHITCNSVY